MSFLVVHSAVLVVRLPVQDTAANLVFRAGNDAQGEIYVQTRFKVKGCTTARRRSGKQQERLSAGAHLVRAGFQFRDQPLHLMGFPQKQCRQAATEFQRGIAASWPSRSAPSPSPRSGHPGHTHRCRAVARSGARALITGVTLLVNRRRVLMSAVFTPYLRSLPLHKPLAPFVWEICRVRYRNACNQPEG